LREGRGAGCQIIPVHPSRPATDSRQHDGMDDVPVHNPRSPHGSNSAMPRMLTRECSRSKRPAERMGQVGATADRLSRACRRAPNCASSLLHLDAEDRLRDAREMRSLGEMEIFRDRDEIVEVSIGADRDPIYSALGRGPEYEGLAGNRPLVRDERGLPCQFIAVSFPQSPALLHLGPIDSSSYRSWRRGGSRPRRQGSAKHSC
jgi:hypothetical protein